MSIQTGLDRGDLIGRLVTGDLPSVAKATILGEQERGLISIKAQMSVLIPTGLETVITDTFNDLCAFILEPNRDLDDEFLGLVSTTHQLGFLKLLGLPQYTSLLMEAASSLVENYVHNLHELQKPERDAEWNRCRPDERVFFLLRLFVPIKIDDFFFKSPISAAMSRLPDDLQPQRNAAFICAFYLYLQFGYDNEIDCKQRLFMVLKILYDISFTMTKSKTSTSRRRLLLFRHTADPMYSLAVAEDFPYLTPAVSENPLMTFNRKQYRVVTTLSIADFDMSPIHPVRLAYDLVSKGTSTPLKSPCVLPAAEYCPIYNIDKLNRTAQELLEKFIRARLTRLDGRFFSSTYRAFNAILRFTVPETREKFQTCLAEVRRKTSLNMIFTEVLPLPPSDSVNIFENNARHFTIRRVLESMGARMTQPCVTAQKALGKPHKTKTRRHK